MRLAILLRTAGLSTIFLTLSVLPAWALLTLTPQDIDWTTEGSSVHFTLHFTNPGLETSLSTPCTVYSQEYGAFVPRQSVIATFTIPGLGPNGTSDIAFDVALADLPPSAGEILPGTSSADGGVRNVAIAGCPPDDHWDGNVDVVWGTGGGGGETQAHHGTLQVCPGGGDSYIHVTTNCYQGIRPTVPTLDKDHKLFLVNEDFSPVGSGLPAGWSGYICTSASSRIRVGETLCYQINFDCGGVRVPVDICVEACDWTTVPVEPTSWGRIKALHR